MINNVILRDTTKEDWPGIRAKMYKRIKDTLGVFPEDKLAGAEDLRVADKYMVDGLTYVNFTYRVINDMWTHGVCILPPDIDKNKTYKAVQVIHGTNELGKDSVIKKDTQSAYGYDLAQRGYVTIQVDQYGFGQSYFDGFDAKFYDEYPDWSLDGLRLLEHKRVLDVAQKFDFVKVAGEYGVTGNSLGGKGTVFLAAFDERIVCAAPGTGVSPNCGNAYRGVGADGTLYHCPILSKQVKKNGIPQYEYEELISLCAPRAAVLFVEPFRDPYNPDTMLTIRCIFNAFPVYELLDCPEKLSMLINGDGHPAIRVVPYVRETVFKWFERFFTV